MLENWWSNGQGKRILLVADTSYWPILLREKEKNPAWNGKIISPDEFLDLVSFRYSEDPIPALLKTGLDYSRAKKWMRLLRIVEDESCPKAKEYREVVRPFICIDPYAETELQRCSIVFFEAKENLELHGMCEKKGLTYEDVTFEDIGFQKKLDEEKSTLPVYSYRTKMDQYLDLFSLLRKRLLEDVESGSKIALHVDERGEEFYLRFASHLFGIPLFDRFETSLRSNPAISSLLMSFYQRKSLTLTEEEMETEGGKKVADVLSYYGLASLPFEQGYVDLEEILSEKREQSLRGDSGIAVFNNFILDPDSETYVLDFRFDRFYKTYADKSVLSDAELLSAGANPSYVNTLLDARLKRNFLCYTNVVSLSVVREHLSDKIYPSQFLKEFAEKNPNWKKAVIRKEVDGEGVFTTAAASFAKASAFDRALCLSPVGEYRSYDSSFKGLGEGQKIVIPSWSISKIEDYASCPFAFLMKRLLPPQGEDCHAAMLGTMFHKVFEKAYEPGFQFDVACQEGEKLYREEAEKRGFVLSGREEVYMRVYREVLRITLAPIQAMKSFMTYHHSLYEEEVFLTLKDEYGSYPFFGRIDKLIFVGEPGNGYYYIGDYKTGKATFEAGEIPFGASIQLPMYHYALEKDARNASAIEGFSFGGFGIQHIDFSNLSQAAKNDRGLYASEMLYRRMAFQGYALDDLDLWAKLDRTGLKENKKGVSLKKGSFFLAKYHSGNADEGEPFTLLGQKATLEDLEKNAVDTCLAIIHAIERGEFPVAPTSSPRDKGPNAQTLKCSYCVYRDICYSKGLVDARQGYVFAKEKGGNHGV